MNTIAREIPCLRHHYRQKCHLPKYNFHPANTTHLSLVYFEDKRVDIYEMVKLPLLLLPAAPHIA